MIAKLMTIQRMGLHNKAWTTKPPQWGQQQSKQTDNNRTNAEEWKAAQATGANMCRLYHYHQHHQHQCL